jgi:hypothetical protein
MDKRCIHLCCSVGAVTEEMFNNMKVLDRSLADHESSNPDSSENIT